MSGMVTTDVKAEGIAPGNAKGGKTNGLLWHVFVAIAALVIIYPVLWMVGTSFKPAAEVVSSVRPWPLHPTLGNYPAGWNGNPGVTFGQFFLNSIVVSTGAVIGNLPACSLAAYAFSRLRFRGREVLMPSRG